MSAGPEAVCENRGRWRGRGRSGGAAREGERNKEGAGSLAGARGDRARGPLGGRVGAALGEGRHLLRLRAARGQAGPPGRLGPGSDKTLLFPIPGPGAGPPGSTSSLEKKLL